jgi:hypothetical protein
MKKQYFPLFVLTLILFMLAGVISSVKVSAKAEAPGGVMEPKKDSAGNSGYKGDDEPVEIEVEYEGGEGQEGAEPALYMLPDGAESELMRKGMPAQVEQRLPLQVQEKRTERNEYREQREEQLRSMNRSDRAEERMSDVAKSVQELLASPERAGGIGKDIRDIAREHQGSQAGLEDNLDDVNSKNKFIKFLVGTDRKALNEVKKEANQIDGRIAQLKALEGTVTGEEQVQLATLIEDLEGQRNDLLETVEVEGSGFSMFGWMRRLFGQKEE